MSNTLELNTTPIISALDHISELKLSSRISNALELQGKETVLDLVQSTNEELLAIRNIGKKSLREVDRGLAEHGLRRLDGEIVVPNVNGSAEKLHPGHSNAPSQEDIVNKCAEIREGWTEAEYRKRVHRASGSTKEWSWLPPVVLTPDYLDPTKDY